MLCAIERGWNGFTFEAVIPGLTRDLMNVCSSKISIFRG